MTFDDCRPEVKAFALLMEQKLLENDHKGGWKEESTAYLSRRCGSELNELRETIGKLHRERMKGWPPVYADTRQKLVTAVGMEAADVANFAMMLADVCGAIASKPQAPGDGNG